MHAFSDPLQAANRRLTQDPRILPWVDTKHHRIYQMRQWHRQGDEQIRALWRQMHAWKDSYDDLNFTQPWIVPNGGHGTIIGAMADRFVETALAFLCEEGGGL